MTNLTRKYRDRLKEAQGLMPSDEAYLKAPEDCPSCGCLLYTSDAADE